MPVSFGEEVRLPSSSAAFFVAPDTSAFALWRVRTGPLRRAGGERDNPPCGRDGEQKGGCLRKRGAGEAAPGASRVAAPEQRDRHADRALLRVHPDQLRRGAQLADHGEAARDEDDRAAPAHLGAGTATLVGMFYWLFG
eukprot:6468450-Prymnesium_polylepis.3